MPPLVAVQLMRNYGQHNALMCGLGIARGEYVVTMDDDLQNPPEEIPKLLDRIRTSGADLVYGCPAERSHAAWRNLGSAVVWSFYKRVFRSPVTPTPFRIMRHQLAKSVLFYDLNFTYLDGLLAWCTSRIESVEVAHDVRREGRSGYSIGKLLNLALNLYTNFSLIPLQVVSAVGFGTALIGFSAGIFYLFQYLSSNIAVPGFASTIIAILILGGAQLLALGVIGEYLGRLHLNVNRKPQYLVRHLSRGRRRCRRPSLAADLPHRPPAQRSRRSRACLSASRRPRSPWAGRPPRGTRPSADSRCCRSPTSRYAPPARPATSATSSASGSASAPGW